MSRLGWLIVFIVGFIAVALFGFFFLMRPAADILGATLEPVGGGEVAEMTGLDRKVVDKAMDALKKTGAIESPVRCKWQPKA